jgi:hypothetical protein
VTSLIIIMLTIRHDYTLLLPQRERVIPSAPEGLPDC